MVDNIRIWDLKMKFHIIPSPTLIFHVVAIKLKAWELQNVTQ
jgi:hypothetical protein